MKMANRMQPAQQSSKNLNYKPTPTQSARGRRLWYKHARVLRLHLIVFAGAKLLVGRRKGSAG